MKAQTTLALCALIALGVGGANAVVNGLNFQTGTLFGLGLGIGSIVTGMSLRTTRMGQLARKRFGKDAEAVSPVVGVILMVAITVVLAAIVFILVSSLGHGVQDAPFIGFNKDDAARTLTVSVADKGIQWSQVAVSGCTPPTSGNVTAGQTLVACAGNVSVVYTPSNTLIFTTRF